MKSIVLKNLIYIGPCSYLETLKFQNDIYNHVLVEKKPILLAFEIEPIITLGLRAKSENEISLTNKIPFCFTDRGGLATLHEPGQLVIYPICPIQFDQISVKEFICLLEKISQKTLARLEIKSFITEDPGIYTKFGKIISIGIRVERGITKHGIAINIKNNLNSFQNIKSCGVSASKMDSLERYMKSSLKDFALIWADEFNKTYDLTKSEKSFNLLNDKGL